MSHPVPTSETADIVVVGAGVVGLALAVALAREGFAIAAVGPPATGERGRTVALLDGSVRMLAALGAWQAVAETAAPLRTMRIVDDTPSLFRGPPVDFKAAEIGLPAFGYNIENGALLEALAAVAAQTPGLQRAEGLVASHAVDRDGVAVRLTDGRGIRSRLVVAADGARSVLRESAGIGAREDRYPQVALTTILAHTVPHGDVSTEFHTRQGPFTLVPLRDGPDGTHRSSLVWVMTPVAAESRAALDPIAFAAAIEAQSRGLLGHIDVVGPVGRFPIRRVVADRLVAPRLALAGEAAHALPPIGAQGLNLSLRDAATLVDLLAAVRHSGGDPGAPAVLDRYERARRGDIALRGAGVHALNLSLLSRGPVVDAARGFGLQMLGALRPVRDLVMSQGLRPSHDVPRLMQTPLP